MSRNAAGVIYLTIATIASVFLTLQDESIGLLLSCVVFAGLCAMMASERGRSDVGWGAAGFFFGIFAGVALLIAGDSKDKDVTSPDTFVKSDAAMERLERLARLRDTGVLSEAEFQSARSKIISQMNQES